MEIYMIAYTHICNTSTCVYYLVIGFLKFRFLLYQFVEIAIKKTNIFNMTDNLCTLSSMFALFDSYRPDIYLLFRV